MQKLSTSCAIGAFAAAMGLAGIAMAATITVLNPSFEADVLANGDFTNNAITDWTVVGSSGAGAFNPNSAHVNETQIPDLDNVAYSNGGTICQTVDTVDALTAYTLTVNVGRRLDIGFPGYTVELKAGGATQASADETSATPAAGEFELVTATWDSPAAGDALIGTNLEICLGSDGVQTLYDDVQLTSVALVTERVVNDDPSGNPNEPAPCDITPDFVTIQAAIDASSDDNTVFVCPGKYHEDLTIPGATGSTENLELAGADFIGIDRPTIKGIAKLHASDFPLAAPNINIGANGVSIHDFTIKSPKVAVDEYSSGIVLTGTNIKIFYNKFKVSAGDGSQAIQTWREDNSPSGLSDISGLHIYRNRFKELEEVDGGIGYEGIFINPQSNASDPANPVVIEDNEFKGMMFRAVMTDGRPDIVIEDNKISTDLVLPVGHGLIGILPRGIQVSGATNISILFNEIESDDGTFVTGILLRGAGANTVRYNEVEEANTGILLEASTSGNTVRDNEIEDSAINDCKDEGTGNIWGDNEGESGNSLPPSICPD